MYLEKSVGKIGTILQDSYILKISHIFSAFCIHIYETDKRSL